MNSEETTTELELNLRLDQYGRTAFISPPNNDPNEQEDDKKNPADDTLNYETTNNDLQINYKSKTVLTSLSKESKYAHDVKIQDDLFDDLLFDCEISDSALFPRTFWISANGMKPRCALEQMALDVFHHHVPKGFQYDPNTSGAEYWAQIRPSPPAGRYNLLSDCQEKDDCTMEKSGICFHWDKDEDLRIMCGGNMYIHPHISTVTYLTSIGPPTLALNHRINAFTGENISPTTNEYNESSNREVNGNKSQAYISWPAAGKHLSFDGRFLHAAPHDLMEEGSFEKQIKVPTNIEDESLKKKSIRRHRRVTFLVNIWLNYVPFNCKPFPMVDKLSKMRDDLCYLLFKNDSSTDQDSDSDSDTEMCFADTIAVQPDETGKATKSNHKFKWSMGNGEEYEENIQMDVPINDIRGRMSEGGNALLVWEYEEGVKLSKTSLVEKQATSIENNVDDQRNKRKREESADE